MKVLYIVDFQIITAIGISNKIAAQIKAFNSAGIKSLEGCVENLEKTLLVKIINKLPFGSCRNYQAMLEKFKGYDAYYIRYFRSDWRFVNFLKELKEANTKAKIVIEIPTYPYDDEDRAGLKNCMPAAKILSYISVLKDRINRKKLYKYVDKITTFSKDEEIWGIKTIRTMNGIDVFNVRKRAIDKNKNQISVITVAGFAHWHGIDRFLEGLGEYYKLNGKRDIIFHIVGYGTADDEETYRGIVKKYNLRNRVIFYGKKTGADLDDIYDKSNIGIGSLGLHRINITLASTLKTREYVAKGLPVIGACKVDMFDGNYPFYLELPSDETAIDMEKVIEFYDKIYPDTDSFQEVHDKIREFSEKTCDMSITMKPVIDFIKGTESK